MFFKKQVILAGLVCLLATPSVAGAEGFGIVEWSAEGVAMGGARMFAEDDAANIAYNPASITKVKNKAYSMGAIYLSPHGKYEAQKKGAIGGGVEQGRNRINPAIAPYAYYVEKINDKEWWGIGNFVRFGMVSEFEKGTLPTTNAQMSKLIGMSITPTYARKLDKKWSAAIGAEFNYVGLTLNKKVITNPSTLASVDTKADGDSFGWGWNAATNYAFDEKNEIGLVYRSKISHDMTADFGMSNGFRTKARGKVVLPDSYTIGYNHKFDAKTRVEVQGMYTRWSTYESLDLKFDDVLPPSIDRKDWSNGWRYAIGVEHKLSDKYTLLGGFAYDGSAIPKAHADFMIPTGNRKTFTLGGQYHDKNQVLTVTLGYMSVGAKDILGKPGDLFDSVHTHDNHVTLFGLGYQRKF
ncbi:MAG: outer membrane protein transport protein [Acidaminococcaceae bacterium]